MSLGSWMNSLFTTTDSSTEAASTSTSSSSSPSYSGPPPIRHSSTTTGGDVGATQRGRGGGEFPALTGTSRSGNMQMEELMRDEDDFELSARPPYTHSMLAGGIGGTCGDMLMHSLDTVKTRQQGDPHIPPKYTSMSSSYATIFRQEGIRRGLYGGVTPALLGSFPGTVIFFGVYESSKRYMLDAGINPSISYLTGGFLADLAASFVYVPSEVLKTRLQLQGRYNNPFFNSGYNYRSTLDGFRTINRVEGFSALYSGFKATLFRDLPFSALQFAFYEQEQQMAKQWVGSKDIGFVLEVVTATTAGGMAGVMTCPLDVVKTRFQTQQNPDAPLASSGSSSTTKSRESHHSDHQQKRPHPSSSPSTTSPDQHSRPISTSSPSTSTVKPGSSVLHTSSIFTGLKLIYQTEGILGWFRGVGPRFLWTSVQSGTMLVLYQFLLKQMDAYTSAQEEEELGTSPL